MTQNLNRTSGVTGWLLLALWLAVAVAGYVYITPHISQALQSDNNVGTAPLQSEEDVQDSLRRITEHPGFKLLLIDLKLAGWDLSKVSEGASRLGMAQGVLDGAVAASPQIKGVALFSTNQDLLLGSPAIAGEFSDAKVFLGSHKDKEIDETARYRVQPVNISENNEPLAWLVARLGDAAPQAEVLPKPGQKVVTGQFVALGYGAVVLALTLLFLIIWWQADTARAKQDSIFYKAVASRIDAQERLFQSIINLMPLGLFIADVQNRLHYANKMFAARLGLTPAQVIGKDMNTLFGPEETAHFAKENRKALENNQAVSEIISRPATDGSQIMTMTSHLAVAGVPIPGTDVPIDGVLVLEQDVTKFANEKERRQVLLTKLLDTVLMIMDNREPSSAYNSRNVGTLAREVCVKLGLDETLAETAEMAGRLMNIGRILIPESLLSQKGKLAEEDLERIRSSVQASADFLKDVPFNGPVVETLRQSQWRLDEKGAAAILITARVITVCNGFVAMTSMRPYRSALSMDESIAKLRENSGKIFDPGVVEALISLLSDPEERRAWESRLVTRVLID